MEENNLMGVERFVVDCNDMLTGRFLDFDKRLERLLSVMALSDDLVEMLASSLENFDENEEMSKAFSIDRKTGLARVSLPSEDKKKLAIVTSLFNRFTSGSLNSTQFLETFFGGEVRLFLQQILLPYRDAVCKAFSLPTDLTADEIVKRQNEALKIKEKAQPQEEEKPGDELPRLGELFGEILKFCEHIQTCLRFEKKHLEVCDDVEFLTNAIVDSCHVGDLKTVNALAVGLNYAAKKLKNVRVVVSEMLGLIYDYYEFLANLSGGAEEAEFSANESASAEESDDFDE